MAKLPVSEDTRRRLRRIAELRVRGRTWGQVGAEMRCHGESCRLSAYRHRDVYKALYAEAFADVFGEAEAEALHEARQGLRSDKPLIRLRAAATILAEAAKRRPVQVDNTVPFRIQLQWPGFEAHRDDAGAEPGVDSESAAAEPVAE